MDLYSLFSKVKSSLDSSIASGQKTLEKLSLFFMYQEDPNSEAISQLFSENYTGSILMGNAISANIKVDSGKESITIEVLDKDSQSPISVKELERYGDIVDFEGEVFKYAGESVTYQRFITQINEMVKTNEVINSLNSMFLNASTINKSDLITTISSYAADVGNIEAISNLKAWANGLPSEINSFDWLMAVKNLYNAVNKDLTGEDLDGRFNNSLPSIQLWSWTAISGVFASVTSMLGAALLTMKPVIGAVLSTAGVILNTLLSAGYGNDEYSVDNKAVNCYLNSPIIAYLEDTTEPDTAPVLRSTPYLDVYMWVFNGKRYLNGYLKPVSSLDGLPLWEVYDRNSGKRTGSNVFGVLTYDGSQLGSSFIANIGGLHYSNEGGKLNTFLINPNRFEAIDYIQDIGCSDLANTNIAMLNSILCVLASLMLPNAAFADKIPHHQYGSGYIFSNPVVHIDAIPSNGNDHMTLRECVNLACGYLYYAASQSGSFTNKNFAIALSNIILSIRRLVQDNPRMIYPSEWSYDLNPTEITNVDPSTFGVYNILDQFLVSSAYFYANASGFKFNADAWNYAALDWDTFQSGNQRSKAIEIYVGLPSRFKYGSPTTTPLFRALALGTTAAVVATTAITAVAIKASYTKKLRNWQIAKAEAFNRQKSAAYGPEGTSADRAKYVKDVNKYNLLANFIPGAATWNPVSGWMQNTMYDSNTTVGASTSSSEMLDKVYTLTDMSDEQNQDGFQRIERLIRGQ